MTDWRPQGAAWVVLPTYQEAENVTQMLEALLRVFDAHELDGRVLVVDDGSPDGTADLAAGVGARDARVQVLRRTVKEGIGPAYRAGFGHVLAEGAELVLEMDCDFSHNPADVPRLIAAAQHADVVLGSRYAPGGGVARWGPVRRAISHGGCWYARRVLGVAVRDLTGGFKCFRRRVLETLPLDQVTASGYVFQIEMTYRALVAGFRVTEVPITFTDRVLGESKMKGSIVVEAATRVPRLRRLGRPPR